MEMQRLRQLVEHGIISDLLKAEQAISVFKTIANYAPKINSREEYLKSSFGYIQYLSINELVLSLNRIYEKYDSRNSNRCFESVLNYLDKNKRTLPPIREKYQLKIQLTQFGLPDLLIQQINIDKDCFLFTEELVKHYRFCIEDCRLQMRTLRTKRDKSLAHNQTSNLKGFNFDDIEPLLDIGWQFSTIIGWAYLNIIYGTHDNFLLKRDGLRRGSQIKRLLQEILK